MSSQILISISELENYSTRQSIILQSPDKSVKFVEKVIFKGKKLALSSEKVIIIESLLGVSY